ncbi:hypothetical protein NQD34_013359 [Periophthalmus magnuspinnatus]|nr:hypothetical protein NQD34_013359 [Periophthalmus magnuspinnatus]
MTLSYLCSLSLPLPPALPLSLFFLFSFIPAFHCGRWTGWTRPAPGLLFNRVKVGLVVAVTVVVVVAVLVVVVVVVWSDSSSSSSSCGTNIVHSSTMRLHLDSSTSDSSTWCSSCGLSSQCPVCVLVAGCSSETDASLRFQFGPSGARPSLSALSRTLTSSRSVPMTTWNLLVKSWLNLAFPFGSEDRMFLR